MTSTAGFCLCWPACPHSLDVRFVWALPGDVWAKDTFNARDVPQIADLSSLKELKLELAARGLSRQTRSACLSQARANRKALQAESRVPRVGKAIMQLVDRDVALVERRVAACKKQYKIAIPLTRKPPQASLSIASSLARSTASTAWGLCPVCSPPVTCPAWPSHSSIALCQNADVSHF